MRPHLAGSLMLAACLLVSVAVAAPDKVEVTFESFGASGVTGSATLNRMPSDEVQIHSTLRGLEPGVEYFVFLYDQSLTCGEGTSSQQIARISANPAGIATWNVKVGEPIESIESLGVRRVVDNQLQACGTVTQ